VRSVPSPNRMILGVSRCVPANMRLWGLETCVLCAVKKSLTWGCMLTVSRHLMSCATFLAESTVISFAGPATAQRAHKVAILCKNARSNVVVESQVRPVCVFR